MVTEDHPLYTDPPKSADEAFERYEAMRAAGADEASREDWLWHAMPILNDVVEQESLEIQVCLLEGRDSRMSFVQSAYGVCPVHQPWPWPDIPEPPLERRRPGCKPL